MAIALRGSGTNNVNGGGSSTTVTVPTGITNGDLMLAFINGYKSGGTGVSVPSDPAGWTKIGEAQSAGGSGAGNAALAMYWRYAASEPANYTFANNGAGDAYIDAGIVAFSGVDGSSPFNLTAVSTAPAGGGTIASGNPGTTTRDGCWYVLAISSYDGISATPGGFTGDDSWDGSPISNWIGHLAISPAGATGAKNFTVNFTDGSAIWAIVLQPPGAAATSPGIITTGYGAN